MIATKTRKKAQRLTPASAETKSVFSDPRQNLDGFNVADTMREIESSVTDSATFYQRMEKNERTRQCQWDGKNGTGTKQDTAKQKARPWNGAADHEVHLAQEVLLQLTAQRTAAMVRGAMNVTPMEGTDAKASGQMKLVMRYYLETAMRSERLIQGSRWASWALRYGHAVLYIGWKTVKSMERREVRESELLEFVMAREIMRRQMAAQQPGAEPLPPVMDETLRANAELHVRELATVEELAKMLIEMKPDLAKRGKAAMGEALKCIKELRADTDNDDGTDPEGHYFTSYVKEDRPVWEALRQGVDFFCPPETMHQDSFDDARWTARVRWVSAQQILEAAAIHEWDQEWVNEVITRCKGKSRMFSERTSGSPWALSGLGVGWTSGERRVLNAERNLYQIIEFYDRRVTEDGVECLYKTVLHPDVPKLVAKRELLPEWHGHQPFVPATNEQDECMLLANRGVPEIVFSAQKAVKAQWDSRTDAASLATVPPYTGPEGMEGVASNIAPGAFIPEWRTGAVNVMKLPPPDGRSIEIEQTLRASVDRYFGLMSKTVPEPLSMLMGQSGVDWFLAAYSRAVALTAQLVQQRMPRLTGARITGTDIVFNATPEEVRGNYDFSVTFDVKALDIEWTKNILNFVSNTILPMDNRALIDRRVFIELGLNMVAPGLTDRAVRSDDAAQQSEIDDEQRQLSAIFSGGVPAFVVGGDHQSRADEMKRDLQSSPVRQHLMAQNEMIAAVWEDRLQKHLHQIMQQGSNKQAGIEGGSDPLKQSPMAKLKAEGWQGVMNGAMMNDQ